MDNLHKNYLEHHGILGMRWGRKMGPPYPLDASDHSAAEKKEGYKKSLGGVRNESLYDRKEKKTSSSKTELKVVMRRKGSDAKSYEKFNNSKEAKAAKKKAYDRTLEYFKEKDPEYLEKITKENGGKTEGLEKFQDFRDKFDAFDVDEWDKAEKEFSGKETKASKKEMKEKAKNYQRAINQLQTNENNLGLKGWELSDSKAYAEHQAAKLAKKDAVKNKEKIDYWMEQSKILDKKISEVASDLTFNRAAINTLLDRMEKDKDIVYRTKYMETGAGGKEYREYSKLLTDKYGKSTVRGGDGGYHSVSGTKYKVAAGTDRNKNKKKYTDPNKKKKYDRKYHSTYYYYY